MSTIVSTFLSLKPNPKARSATLFTLAFMTLITIVAWANDSLSEQWAASREAVYIKSEYYRLWFSMFIHANPAHFFSNAYMFGILTFLVTGYFGIRIYFFILLGLGALVHACALWTYPADLTLIGVSGVVYLLSGFWLVTYVGIDRRFKFSTRLMRALGVGLIILFPTSFEPQVSYRAHGIGFLIGFVFGIFYFLIKKNNFRSFEVLKPEELEEELSLEVTVH